MALKDQMRVCARCHRLIAPAEQTQYGDEVGLVACKDVRSCHAANKEKEDEWRRQAQS